MKHQHPSALHGKSLLEAIATNADLSGLRSANLDSCGLIGFPLEVLS